MAVLTWTAATDNVGVTGYKVYRNGVEIADLNALTYDDSTAPEGKNTYYVKAYDAAGNLSTQSNSKVCDSDAPPTLKIEWDYFTTYTVTTNTEVRAYLKDDVILPFTGGDETQFGLKVNGSPVVFINFGIHYAPGASYVTLRNQTDFLPTDVIEFSYTAGADPIEGENTGTFASDLVDQLVENTVTPPTNDPDYQAYLDRLTTLARPLPSVGQQEYQNQLVLDLKTAGVWSKADVISLFATDAGAESSKVNLFPPSLYENTLQNTPIFESSTGWTNTGGDGRIVPNYIPTTDGVNFTTNNSSLFVYVPSGLEQTKHAFGVYNAAGAIHYGSGIASRMNSSATFAVSIILSTKLVGLKRDNSANFNLSLDGIDTNFVLASTNVPPVPISYLGRSGTANVPLNKPVSFGFIGSYLSNTEVVDMNTAIETYLVSIGSLMSSLEVDNYLINEDNIGTTNKTIDLSKNAQPRSSGSDTAVANLISRNVTVITN